MTNRQVFYPNHRKLTEYPWLLVKSQQYDRLWEYLSEFVTLNYAQMHVKGIAKPVRLRRLAQYCRGAKEGLMRLLDV